MLYNEIIAVCSQIQTKHINTLCGQNVECRTYRAVNTLRLGYKNQPVNAVQWNNRCFFLRSTRNTYIQLCGQNVECRTYRAVNTLRLNYTSQPVNAVQWNNRSLFSDPHKTHNVPCVERTKPHRRRTVTIICLFRHRHIKQLLSSRCHCPLPVLVFVTALMAERVCGLPKASVCVSCTYYYMLLFWCVSVSGVSVSQSVGRPINSAISCRPQL